jgi:hypothetical protein
VIKWGDRCFVELKLMFGTRSSPGIFDELAKAFLWCTRELAGMPRYAIQQHIDDVLGVRIPGDNSPVWLFHRTYLEEALKVGIRLDQSRSKEKQQEPGTSVVALGVRFDTQSWTWGLKPEKMARILISLDEIRRVDRISLKEIESITGKLTNVKTLVAGGKYNMLHFLLATHKSEADSMNMIRVPEMLREQVMWWSEAFVVADKHSPIIHPDPQRPSNAAEAGSDAAGGTSTHMGAGLGVVTRHGDWAYLPRPYWLNQGGINSDGHKFNNKLTCLESMGLLVALGTMGMKLTGEVLVVHVDNQGAVDIFKKGHSTKCIYTSPLVKATHDLAWAMGCTVLVEKVRICSDAGSYLADMISRGQLSQFRELMLDRSKVATLPGELIGWIMDPRGDLHLGHKMAVELRGRWPDIIPVE